MATISHVEMETVGQGADRKEKPVLHLEGQKPLIMNVTNTEALAEVFGDETDDWAGQKLKIFCDKTQYQGKATDGIRVRPIVPKPAARPAADDPDDELPAA